MTEKRRRTSVLLMYRSEKECSKENYDTKPVFLCVFLWIPLTECPCLRAVVTDTGNYSCQPSNAEADTVQVHVLEGTGNDFLFPQNRSRIFFWTEIYKVWLLILSMYVTDVKLTARGIITYKQFLVLNLEIFSRSFLFNFSSFQSFTYVIVINVDGINVR